jgi:pimeloyl-ACP methyl ester carboxylesterase
VKVVLLAGWHEASGVMRTFIDGRHNIDGLAAYGFDCTIFPSGRDALRPRVDRFAQFLDNLKVREPESFPVATVGYSAGALVNRGFLRAYPERAGEIAATVQIGAPNCGLVSNYIANILKLMWIPHRVINDLDVASDFLTWLNDTTGSWIPTDDPKHKVWKLDRTPWTVPEGHRVLSIAGKIAKEDSDGVIRVDSATLQDHLPHVVIADKMANHLNLGAVFDIVALLGRGFRSDDRIWHDEVEIIARFLRGESIPTGVVPASS